MASTGVVGVTWFFSWYHKFTLAQFGVSLIVIILVGILLRWLRADRRGFALAIFLTAVGAFGVLYWANSQVTTLSSLDNISRRLCRVRPGGLVSVTVYKDNETVIGYARSHDSKGISDSYYTEYFDRTGTLLCTQASFSTDRQDKCAVAMRQAEPPVDIAVAAQREVCGNFPI